MNKLQGFYELQRLGIPTVPWKEFDDNTVLDKEILWTVRTAVLNGEDFNLPRAIGVSSEIAKQKYREFSNKLTSNDLIIYYPFFVAHLSGIIEIYKNKIIIEACKGDLWNLVTHGLRDATYFISKSQSSCDGNQDFLTSNQIDELIRYAPSIRVKYKDYLSEGKSIALEWSYASKSNLFKEPVGTRYLVFYELRLI